jgi:hypothetical protein
MEAKRGAYPGLSDTPSTQAHADGPSGWGRANRPAGARVATVLIAVILAERENRRSGATVARVAGRPSDGEGSAMARHEQLLDAVVPADRERA